MKIKIERPDEQSLKEIGITNWPIWTKDVSSFDWYYDSTEECYIIEGRVIVETKDGNKVEIKKGDFVTFPKNLACHWDIKEPIRKHYNFKGD